MSHGTPPSAAKVRAALSLDAQTYAQSDAKRTPFQMMARLRVHFPSITTTTV
jgi:hypothetical protein